MDRKLICSFSLSSPVVSRLDEFTLRYATYKSKTFESPPIKLVFGLTPENLSELASMTNVPLPAAPNPLGDTPTWDEKAAKAHFGDWMLDWLSKVYHYPGAKEYIDARGRQNRKAKKLAAREADRRRSSKVNRSAIVEELLLVGMETLSGRLDQAAGAPANAGENKNELSHRKARRSVAA